MLSRQSTKATQVMPMQTLDKWLLLLVALTVLAVVQLTAARAYAQPTYFASRCAGCHAAPVQASCNACHQHGPGGISGSPGKTSYAAGENVVVNVIDESPSKGGWVRAILYDQSMVELARSTGNASGKGSSFTLPNTLTAPAPQTPGNYAWKLAWYGNNNGKGHVEEIVSTISFTVTGPPDTIAPTVTAFTLPADSSTLTVPVTSFTATDNIAVTGYLVTTSATAPLPGASGWKGSAPASVTAPGAGSITFYAWARDAAGNVSLAASATVTLTVTVPDKKRPKVTEFTLPASSSSLTVPVNSLAATDDIGVTGYLVTTSKTAPAVGDAGWSASPPATATATTTNKAGKALFYAWAKDAAGRVSKARKATVTITQAPALTVDLTNPALAVSTLASGATTGNLTLNVSGQATDAGGLRSVTVNGKAANVGQDGTFSSAVMLAGGDNVITVAATDLAGNQAVVSRILTGNSAALAVTIATPADNQVSAQPLLTVRGQVAGDATVLVGQNDDNPQVASRTGDEFSAAIYLVPGLNTIMVTATDPAGQVSSAKRTVIFDDGTPTLAITEPGQDVVTHDATIRLAGVVADALSTVTVTVACDGKVYQPTVTAGVFAQTLTFAKEQGYAITVTATDAGGNDVAVTRNVIYQAR